MSTGSDPGQNKLRRKWRQLSLAQQYGAASSLVLVCGMFAIGMWVANEIKQRVIQNTANATALYMDSFVVPLVGDLRNSEMLSPATQKKLDNLLKSTAIGNRIVSFKIWREGGLIAYASNKAIMGKKFRPTRSLKRAWSGVVASEFDSLYGDENKTELAIGVPLLEMYSPIRDARTGRVIGVAEFYERAQTLKNDLFYAKLKSWFVVGIVTAVMMALLFIIVRRGSSTIQRQKLHLEEQVDRLQRFLDQNEDLRQRLQIASGHTARINESFLKRIGADLHDGPAQHLGLLMLRLDAIEALIATLTRGQINNHPDVVAIRSAATDALKEIRELSSGLALPDIERLPLCEVLIKAIETRERRTKSIVHTKIVKFWFDVSPALKICLYRFVAEALNNAYRHAEGRGQVVRAALNGSVVVVIVSDSGPGLEHTNGTSTDHGLGLIAMRTRIESLGGRLDIRTSQGRGTHLIAQFSLRPQELARTG